MPAATSGCVVVVRSLEISTVEQPRLETLFPTGAESARGLKQSVKLQLVDGGSVLFREKAQLVRDTVTGDGLRVDADALGQPQIVRQVSVRHVVGGVAFRERTNMGASVAATVALTAVGGLVIGAITSGFEDAMNRAMGEAFACALAGRSCTIAGARVPVSPGLRPAPGTGLSRGPHRW